MEFQIEASRSVISGLHPRSGSSHLRASADRLQIVALIIGLAVAGIFLGHTTTRARFFLCVVTADCRWKHACVDLTVRSIVIFARLAARLAWLALFLLAIGLCRFALDPARTLLRTVVTIISTIIAAVVVLATRTAVAATAIIAIVVAITIVIGLVAFVLTLGTRFFLTRLVVRDHAEIVVGKLQVILLLHSVAIVLRVLGKLLVLVEKLRSIAARAAVDPVGTVSATLMAIAATAAPVISIVIQGIFFLIRDRTRNSTVLRPLDPMSRALPTWQRALIRMIRKRDCA